MENSFLSEIEQHLDSQDGGSPAAETYGRTRASLRTVAQELWAGGGALDVQVIGESGDHLDSDVTRCHRTLQGARASEIGYHVHCTAITITVGFNGELELSRSRTIMEGATCCDFRFSQEVLMALTS